MCCIGNTTGFAYILAIRLGQHAWNQMGLAAHTQGCSNTSHTHTKQQLFDWNIMLGENYIYYNYTCHFKPQYRKLLSTFWTVSSAKDTNNKSGAHLSYASVPSFWHAQGCQETCSPPKKLDNLSHTTSDQWPPWRSCCIDGTPPNTSDEIECEGIWDCDATSPANGKHPKISQIYPGMKPH